MVGGGRAGRDPVWPSIYDQASSSQPVHRTVAERACGGPQAGALLPVHAPHVWDQPADEPHACLSCATAPAWTRYATRYMRGPTGIAGWLQPAPLIAVVLWGGIYPAAKVALQDFPVLSFTALRLALATVVLFIASGHARQLALPPGQWKSLLNAGLAQTVFQILLVAGLDRTTAGNSAVLLATAPLLTALWLMVTRRDRLTRRQWSGFYLGLAGVALVVGGGVSIARAYLWGDLLALAAAAGWAWYGLAVSPLVRDLGALRATGWTMLVGTLIFVPLASPDLHEQAWGDVSWGAWAGYLYSATAGMVVAMALWGRAIHHLGPRQTMLYVYLEPVSAVVVAAVVLGEVFTPMQAVGALLTFIGMWLAS